jgi:hypothetical protein
MKCLMRKPVQLYRLREKKTIRGVEMSFPMSERITHRGKIKAVDRGVLSTGTFRYLPVSTGVFRCTQACYNIRNYTIVSCEHHGIFRYLALFFNIILLTSETIILRFFRARKLKRTFLRPSFRVFGGFGKFRVNFPTSESLTKREVSELGNFKKAGLA